MSIASLYPSINPSLLLDFANVKRLDPRITFTRTTTATYYDGVTTAVAEQNLLTYSQAFGSWPIARATVTGDTTVAPDGTTTADTITQTSTGLYGTPYRQFTTSAATYTQSVYAKAGTASWLFLGDENSGKRVYFNISAGTIGSVASGTTATITSVGSGWYRCSVTFTLAAVQGTFINAIVDGDGSTNAVGGTTIILWGAQLEQRSSVTAYTATTTQAITNYIPVLQTASAGQARFDHNPTTGESLGLLIEEARTNLCLQSEDFNTGWTASTATVLTNATIAPNGTVTADKIIPSSTGSNRGYYRTFTASGATTTSFYLKYGGYQWVRIEGPSGSGSVWFDLLNGVKGTEGASTTGTITAVGNGWYRCTCTQTISGTAYVTIYLTSADNSNSVTVATNDVFSGVFVWGAQAETSGSSFATSYIPTTTASATRNADAASMTGTNFSSWFGGGNISSYVEAAFKGYVPNQGSIAAQLSDGSTANNIDIYWYNGIPIYYVTAAGTNQVNLQTSVVAANVYTKFSTANAFNDSAVSFNGAAIQTDSSCILPTGLNKLNIGNTQNYGIQYLSGWIKKIAFYPQRLTNTNLVALTT